MRRLLSTLVDRLLLVRARRRLARYGVDGPGASLDRLTLDLEAVPGMMTREAGPMLFALAATQALAGDIVEIGSWQGRSTIFLASGARAAANGTVYAVDHFRGNAGKEHLFRAGRDDLSDLPGRFGRNVERFGVSDRVELLAVDSASAARTLRDRDVRVRLLFIDGNHEHDAVRADVDAFRGLLLPRALVVFDDYSTSFPGVTRCVHELVAAGALAPRFQYGRCFVAEAVRP
ncbi:MAG: class I SAM-dependent methyltransferase [Vicinamibacterales bacterium]